MSVMKDMCVIEIGEGWAVRREGELTLVSVHDTAEEATLAAIAHAQREGCGVLVQGREGRYREVPVPPLASKPTANAGQRSQARR